MTESEDRIVKHSVDQIPIVSDELYFKTRKELSKLGYTFVVAIRAALVVQLIEEDQWREANGQERIMGVVDPTLQEETPEEIEIAINLAEIPIARSHGIDTDGHIIIVAEEKTRIKASLPEDIRSLISVRMPTASMVVQLDTACREREKRPLFPDWFARVKDKVADGLARVGRYEPTEGMRIRGRDSRQNVNDVFAITVVVLPKRAALTY